jgi:GT2 family glycosyltransferase
MSAQAPPLVTVAILAYNRRDPLAVTLEKVLGDLDHPADRLEVIVVDNASTDGTAEMVAERFPSVTVIRNEENVGIGGWNRAFEAGRGEWFLVLDDDCYPPRDALRRGFAAAAEHEADLVSFDVDSITPGEAFSEVYRTGLLSFWGCAVMISRRALDRVGGFDEGLFIWAHELDYTMRLLHAGLSHVLLPDVRAVHMKAVAYPAAWVHHRNMHNWGYLAAKLLQPRDAARAVVNLTVRGALESVVDRRHIQGSLAAWRGFAKGLKVRSPVRSRVSRLYLRHFLEFGSFVRIGPRVRTLVAERGRGGLDFRRRFWADRPRLYPRDATAIRVP